MAHATSKAKQSKGKKNYPKKKIHVAMMWPTCGDGMVTMSLSHGKQGSHLNVGKRLPNDFTFLTSKNAQHPFHI